MVSVIFVGFTISAYAADPDREVYAVGGEIIPVNTTQYLMAPLLVGIVVVAALIIASVTIEGFPVRIVFEKQ
jgi:hypothetical protein